MKMLNARCLVLVASVLAASPAWAVVIDFEGTGPFPAFYNPLTTQGFTFTSGGSSSVVTIFNGTPCNSNCAANGTATFIAGGLGLNPFTDQPVVMTSAAGNSFYLNAFDFAEFVGDSASYDKNELNASWIVLRGNLSGGGSVSQLFPLDGLNDGPGGANDFQSALLSPIWVVSRLSSLEFQGYNLLGPTTPRGFMLDNIDSTEVPEPGTLTLIGAGLAGLGLRRRRRS